MSVRFELDLSFLRAERVPLSSDELAFGFEHGWLRAPALVDVASQSADADPFDPSVLELRE